MELASRRLSGPCNLEAAWTFVLQYSYTGLLINYRRILQNPTFPYWGLWYLQRSTGSPHRIPGAASERLTYSVDRLLGNTWPPRATISLMTDASSVTETVHTTFGSTSQEDHNVQIAVWTRVEPPQNCNIAQIPGHTNYAR